MLWITRHLADCGAEMTNYLVTPWALADRNVLIWRWVQQPEVTKKSDGFFFAHICLKNKASKDTKEKSTIKGTMSCSQKCFHFSAHYIYSIGSSSLNSFQGVFPVTYWTSRVMHPPSKLQHQPTPLQQCLHTFLVSHVKNLMQPFFDPDGTALPLFFFIVTIPRSSPDLSHLDVLAAWYVLLAPAGAHGGCLRFRGAKPDFTRRWKWNLTFISCCINPLLVTWCERTAGQRGEAAARGQQSTLIKSRLNFGAH